MATIPQIRPRLLELFSEKQADLLAHVVIEAHDDLVTRADFHKLTGVVADLADSQRQLTEAQTRTEVRIGELAEAQTQTAVSLTDLVQTQQKMLIRLDRLDGHVMEDRVAKNLPAFMGRGLRRCRVLDRAGFVESLEGLLPEKQLDDLMRADVFAIAKRRDEPVHPVVEASCTAAADDLERAERRAAAVASAGFVAIGVVACGQISPQTLAAARERGLRVITDNWLLPAAA